MNTKPGPCGHRIVSVGQKGSAAREYSDAGACGMCKESGCNYAVMYAGHCDKKPHFAVTLCGCQNWPVQVSKWYAQRSDAILYAKKLSEWNGIKYNGLNYSGQFDGKQCTILVAVDEFTFVNPGTNRKNTVKAGDEWWVTDTSYNIKAHNSACIAPAGKNAAWAIRFSLDLLAKHFKIKESQ